MWPGALHRHFEQIEAAHAGGVGIDIGVALQHGDESQLRLPVIREAAEVRDNEIDLGVLRRQKLYQGYLAHHVVQHGQPEGLRHPAHLPADASVVPMYFDALEAEAQHRLPHHGVNPAPVGSGIHEGEAAKAPGIAAHQRPHLAVGPRIVGVEGGKEVDSLYAGLPRPD